MGFLRKAYEVVKEDYKRSKPFTAPKKDSYYNKTADAAKRGSAKIKEYSTEYGKKKVNYNPPKTKKTGLTGGILFR